MGASLSTASADSNDAAAEPFNMNRAAAAARRAPLPKVHLHMHLDGAIRPATLYEIAVRKGVKLPEDVSGPADIEKYMRVPRDCSSLVEFLSVFPFFLPVVQGDGDAIERVAFESCEDEAASGVAYFEARFAPHLLMTDELSPAAVVERVLSGLRRGREAFGVDSRVILCCMRHRPDWSLDVVALADKFRGSGVVAIDLAGDESQPTDPHVAAFDEARRLGIPATVHAGEACGAESVTEALDRLHAARIGHGYRSVEDGEVYDRVRRDQVHLEVCLTSSIQTGAVKGGLAALATHPAIRFAADGVNFGLNTDDPSVCGVSLADEYGVASADVGLDDAALEKASLDAAAAAFLPDDERAALVERVREGWAAYRK